MESESEKYAGVSWKNDNVFRKKHLGNTTENEIKELEPMKAYKYFDVEERT